MDFYVGYSPRWLKNFSFGSLSPFPAIVNLGMNYIDLIILVPILYGAVHGFMKGFVVAISGLVALVLGIYGAILLSDRLGVYLAESHGLEGELMPFVAFALVFLGIVIGVHFLGKLIQKGIEMAALGIVNKLAGGLFGAAKAALILSVVILLVEKVDTYFEFLPKDKLAESTLYGPMSDITQEYFPKIADSQAFEALKEKAGEAKEEIEGALE